MTSPYPGRSTPTAGSPSFSRPVARISHVAIARNIGMLSPAGSDPLLADLRHDAWGHGAAEVAATLLAHGIDLVRVDAARLDEVREAAPARSDRVVADVPAGAASVDLLSVYGLPGADGHGAVPAMSLTGTVVSLKALRAGEGVSYGYLHRATVDTTIALVTGGYAQGIVRSLGNRASVAIGGHRHPIVGRVAMDVCVVDVGDAQIERGDTVTYFGGTEDSSLGEWIRVTGLTPAELVTTVGSRADREHVR